MVSMPFIPNEGIVKSMSFIIIPGIPKEPMVDIDCGTLLGWAVSSSGSACICCIRTELESVVI